MSRRLIFVVYLFLMNPLLGVVLAQQSNVQVGRDGASQSATSVLGTTVPNGRIGGSAYNGTMSPSSNGVSRFSNGSAVIDSSGKIMGIDRSTSSRFGGLSAPFQSKMNYDLLIQRNEMNRLMGQSQDASTLRGNSDGLPRLVTAREPQRIPYSTRRQNVYGSSSRAPRSMQEDSRLSRSDPSLQSGPEGVMDSTDPARQIWMRGRAPLAGADSVWMRDPQYYPDFDGSWGTLNQTGYYDGYNVPGYPYDLPPNGVLGGSLNDASGFGAWTFPRIRTAEDERQQFIEYLETQLLRSPDVNPLSPIQVSYVDGTVTVRGVVPTPNARLAAGKILLSNPQVKKVNNLMTYVRNNDGSEVGSITNTFTPQLNGGSANVPQGGQSGVQPQPQPQPNTPPALGN